MSAPQFGPGWGVTVDAMRSFLRDLVIDLLDDEGVRTKLRQAVDVARPERDPDALIAVADAATELWTSEAAIRKRLERAERDGTIQLRRIGRSVRVRRGDLAKLVRR